jgi:hypothetical protein
MSEENPTDYQLLYPRFEKEIKRDMKRIEENPKVLECNKEYCRGFVQHCQAKKLSDARIAYYLQRLVYFAVFFA